MAGSINAYKLTDKEIIRSLSNSQNTLRDIFNDITNETLMLYKESIEMKRLVYKIALGI